MSFDASTTAWNTGSVRRRGFAPRPAWEITGIILGFIFAWPLALAYLIWKFAGYPVPKDAKATLDGVVARVFGTADAVSAMRGTSNSAFEEYRRRELARLEEERRRLDEESRAFADFMDELKRARDREEFDAFMAKRRADSARTA